MTPESENLAELRDLLAALHEGTLSDKQEIRLNSLVAEDAAARQFYLERMFLYGRLQWEHRPGLALIGQPREASASPAIESAASAIRSPVLGFLGGVVDYVNHSRRLMFLLVAAMLSGWFIFQVGSVLVGRWWAGGSQVADGSLDHPGGRGQKSPDGGLPGAPSPSHGNALAWLSGSVGSRWQTGGRRPASAEFWEIGSEFTAGERVNLVAGLGEITFRSGAKVVISAPARFSVTSALGTDLQVGKLAAQVPHDAIGFTVVTPVGSVVDLGTEFGVEVTPDRKMDVQVFVGAVKVNAPSGGGEVAEPAGVRVTAGQTVHVVAGHPAALVESKDNRFQRDLKIASDSAAKQMAAYLDFVRQLRPAVWLRMEGKEGDKTLHDEVGNVEAKLFWDGPGNPFVTGAVGKGLWLRGPELQDGAILPDYPKAEHGKLSVAAWVFADSRPADATIAKNWGVSDYGQFHFGLFSELTGEGQDLSVEIARPDGTSQIVREGRSHRFPLDAWQHVAFVADGSTLRLYRQGHEVAAAAYAGLPYPTRIKALGIGVKTGDSGQAAADRRPGYWSGKIDELVIFNDALTPEQIKKLAVAPPR